MPARTASAGRPAPYALSPMVIEERDKDFLYSLELPGLRRRDLRVGVRKGLLVIGGTRRLTRAERGSDYSLAEEDEETFERSCSLPSGVASRGMKAIYRDGRLFVSVPRSRAGRPRNARIRVA